MDDYIKTLVDIASAMYENSMHSDETDSSKKKIGRFVERDIGHFMTYLALSDGTISQDEADEISVMMNKAGIRLPGDPDIIAQFAKDLDILTMEFESEAPYSFKNAVFRDNIMVNKAGYSNAAQLSRLLLTVYKILGRWFIGMDGEVSKGERINYDTYIKTLEDYRDANYIGNDEDNNIDGEGAYMDDADEDMDAEDEDMDDEDEDMDAEDEDMDDEDEDTDDEGKDTVSNIDDCIKEILARTSVKHGVEAPRKG